MASPSPLFIEISLSRNEKRCKGFQGWRWPKGVSQVDRGFGDNGNDLSRYISGRKCDSRLS